MTDDLLIKITRFNWLPASYVEASWLSPWIQPGQLIAIRNHNDASRSLNRFLLESPEPLAAVPDEVFSAPFPQLLLQLLLWPKARIYELVVLSGLALNHLRIKQIICREAQQRFKKTFSEDAYRFALQRAPFLLGSMTDALVLTDTNAYHFSNNDTGLEHHIIDTGFMFFALVTSTLPESAKKRLRYVFTTEHAAQLDRYWQTDIRKKFNLADQGSQVRENAQTLLFKLVQEKEPQWKPVSI